MFKKIIFWSHLTIGVTAGAVILIMSITGALLTYEHQIRSWSLSQRYSLEPSNEFQKKLLLAEIINIANTSSDNREINALIVTPQATDPITISYGKGNYIFINPYSGEVMGDHKQGPHKFFDLVWRWHRWFDMNEDTISYGRAITGAANLGFIFLIVSGFYQWFPKTFNWLLLRKKLFFNKQVLNNSKMRDRNWHDVLGIWSVLPLLIIALTATTFYYSWAQDIRNWLTDESIDSSISQSIKKPLATYSKQPQSLEELLIIVRQQSTEWKTISIQDPENNSFATSFTIDKGNSRQPQKKSTVVLDNFTGEVIKWEPFSKKSKSSRWGSYIRYLHTGEALGLFGQTIAGLVSVFSCIMVWTGLAMAYRRFRKYTSK